MAYVEDPRPPDDPGVPTPPTNPAPTPTPAPEPSPTPAPATTYGSRTPIETFVNNASKWGGYLNPSVTNDPNYWITRINQSPGSGGVANPDWGYWQGRMQQPEGPPEGSPSGGGGGSYSGADALARAQQQLGRTLSPQELANINARYGFNQNTQFTDSMIQNVLGYVNGGGGTQTRMADNPNGSYGGYGPRSYPGGGVFNDPATAPFEQLLNQRINQLMSPYVPYDMPNALSYLQRYFQQLQGPAYTPEQMDLQQTQTIDPMTRQRDQDRARAIAYYAARGQGSDSGPVNMALRQIDQGYNDNLARTRSGFANNAIGLQRQNFQQAAGLGPQIASLEQQLFNNQENRSNSAVNMAQIIPNMAWQRLQGGQNGVQQTNPLQALQLLNGFQTQGFNQGNEFGSGLAQILPYLLQLFARGGQQNLTM